MLIYYCFILSAIAHQVVSDKYRPKEQQENVINSRATTSIDFQNTTNDVIPMWDLHEKCENRTLQMQRNCCWCDANSDTSVICILLGNQEMKNTLNDLISLNYHEFVTNLTLMLTDSSSSTHPLFTEYNPFQLNNLTCFPVLQQLQIRPSNKQSQYVPLKLKKDTFYGCPNITHLQINIPLVDFSKIKYIVQPLKQLQVLDFNNVRGISFQNMQTAMSHLSLTVKRLDLHHFQSIGQKYSIIKIYSYLLSSSILPQDTI